MINQAVPQGLGYFFKCKYFDAAVGNVHDIVWRFSEDIITRVERRTLFQLASLLCCKSCFPIT